MHYIVQSFRRKGFEMCGVKRVYKTWFPSFSHPTLILEVRSRYIAYHLVTFHVRVKKSTSHNFSHFKVNYAVEWNVHIRKNIFIFLSCFLPSHNQKFESFALTYSLSGPAPHELSSKRSRVVKNLSKTHQITLSLYEC